MANIKGTKNFSVGDKKINNSGDEFTIIEYIDRVITALRNFEERLPVDL